MDLKKEINKINNERLPNTNRTERLITLFAEYHQALQLRENAVSSCSWIDAVFHHPVTYKTGNFDGKNSDLVLVKDAYGKIYIGYMNECIMDGSHTKDWYDQNDFEIKKVVEWIKLPGE